jgi:hypothetical protein
MPATDYDATRFFDGLVSAGLIVPVGVPGVFGRNHVFEDVLARFDAQLEDSVGLSAEKAHRQPGRS